MCVSMFLGSILFAFVPIYATLTRKNVRMMTVFGAGLILGTAFAVIIPEGIHILLSAFIEIGKFALVNNISISHSALHHISEHHSDHAGVIEADLPLTTPLSDGVEHNNIAKEEFQSYVNYGVNFHQQVGVFLAFGFVFMMVVDWIGGGDGVLSQNEPSRA